MNKNGCNTNNKKVEEKNHNCGCGCNHKSEKTATNNQWGK